MIGDTKAPKTLGLPCAKRVHLVGFSDWTTAWAREARLAKAEALESVVLFALHQFALIGYPAPVSEGARRAVFLGRVPG